MTTTLIRPEKMSDERGIRRVNELAFGRADEADLVEALRANGGVTLSLVAEQDGDLVGHILFSPVTITSSDAASEASGLAPMAVLPELQRSGIGSRLVRAGLDALREAGHEIVVVLGHADYYPRFGFKRASRCGILWELDCPDEAFMVLELRPGALQGKNGVVRYRQEFSGLD